MVLCTLCKPFSSKSLLLPGVGDLFSTLIILHAHYLPFMRLCSTVHKQNCFSMCGLWKTHSAHSMHQILQLPSLAQGTCCLSLEFEEFLGVRFATRPKDYSSEFGSAVLGSYCFCSVCSKVLLQCQGLVRSLGALYDNVSSRVSCR